MDQTQKELDSATKNDPKTKYLDALINDKEKIDKDLKDDVKKEKKKQKSEIDQIIAEIEALRWNKKGNNQKKLDLKTKMIAEVKRLEKLSDSIKNTTPITEEDWIEHLHNVKKSFLEANERAKELIGSAMTELESNVLRCLRFIKFMILNDCFLI